MPDALELPWMRRTVIPLVRARDAIINELVPHWLPGFAAVVGALDQLSEPATALRSVQPVRVRGRPFHVVEFKAREVRAADVPPFALSIRLHYECALACTYQY